MNKLNKKYLNKKGFTLVELLVSIVLTIMLSTIIFNGIQSVITAQNRDRAYRTLFSSFSEGLSKGQKIIYENSTTLSGSFGTVTNSGSLLSFSKEDSYGIERLYFLNLDRDCLLNGNSKGIRLTITDGVIDPIRLTGCINPANYNIQQEVKYMNVNLKEKLVNYNIYITDIDNNKTTIKNTIFTR